jgi:hypothetical protein
MAKAKKKSKADKDLYGRLRDSGVRKKVARQISQALPDADDPWVKQAKRAADQLGAAASEIGDLVTGGPQKRSKAAKKAAKTRKENKAKKKKTGKKSGKKRK